MARKAKSSKGSTRKLAKAAGKFIRSNTKRKAKPRKRAIIKADHRSKAKRTPKPVPTLMPTAMQRQITFRCAAWELDDIMAAAGTMPVARWCRNAVMAAAHTAKVKATTPKARKAS